MPFTGSKNETRIASAWFSRILPISSSDTLRENPTCELRAAARTRPARALDSGSRVEESEREHERRDSEQKDGPQDSHPHQLSHRLLRLGGPAMRLAKNKLQRKRQQRQRQIKEQQEAEVKTQIHGRRHDDFEQAQHEQLPIDAQIFLLE